MKNPDKKNLSTIILIGYEPTAELKETMLTKEKMKNEQMNEERRKIKLQSEDKTSQLRRSKRLPKASTKYLDSIRAELQSSVSE